jgi:hypothetical protein
MSKMMPQLSWRALLCVVILSLFSLVSATMAGGPPDQLIQGMAGARGGGIHTPAFAPGELFVRFADGAAHSLMTAAHARVGAAVIQEYHSIVPNLQLIKIPGEMTMQEALTHYRNTPGFIYAHPNWIVEAQEVPNDSLWSELWSLQNTGQAGGGTPGADIQAPEAWDLTVGHSNVVVAVIDSGISITSKIRG